MAAQSDAWRGRMEEKIDDLLQNVAELKVKVEPFARMEPRVGQLESALLLLSKGRIDSERWERDAEKRLRDLEGTIIKDPVKLENRVRSLEDNRTSVKGGWWLAVVAASILTALVAFGGWVLLNFNKLIISH